MLGVSTSVKSDKQTPDKSTHFVVLRGGREGGGGIDLLSFRLTQLIYDMSRKTWTIPFFIMLLRWKRTAAVDTFTSIEAVGPKYSLIKKYR